MREKYESLSVAVLRDLAKSRGIAKVSTMKKAELIEAMVAEDEKAQPASEDAKNIDAELIIEKLGGLPKEKEHCAELVIKTLNKALENVNKREVGCI